MPEPSVNSSKKEEIILGNAAKMGRKEKFLEIIQERYF